MLPAIPLNLNLHGHACLEYHFVAVILHGHPVQEDVAAFHALFVEGNQLPVLVLLAGADADAPFS